MANVTVSTDIGVPVGAVFSRFSDIEHAASHVWGVKRTELLTIGPFGLGTRWRETRELLGRQDEAEMEVTSFEKNRQYTITHHKAGVRIDARFTFDPIPRGTKVTVEFGLNGQGLPPGLLAPINWAIEGKVRDVLSADLADLKLSAEFLAAR